MCTRGALFAQVLCARSRIPAIVLDASHSRTRDGSFPHARRASRSIGAHISLHDGRLEHARILDARRASRLLLFCTLLSSPVAVWFPARLWTHEAYLTRAEVCIDARGHEHDYWSVHQLQSEAMFPTVALHAASSRALQVDKRVAHQAKCTTVSCRNSRFSSGSVQNLEKFLGILLVPNIHGTIFIEVFLQVCFCSSRMER